MVLAVTFPDQDSFYKRMGVEVYENYGEVLPIYKRCKRISGIDLVETLMYENTNQEWNEESKKIAVLVSSVAFYTAWKNLYKIEPDYYFGCGIGLLSALVCTKTISLSAAIKVIKGKRISSLFVKNVKAKVVSVQSQKVLSSKEDVMEVLEVCQMDSLSNDGYEEMIKQLNIEQLLDIGPGNVTSMFLQMKFPQLIVGFIDKTNDNNYVLEHFEYRKNHSRYYCVLRILGIITNTKNENSNQETYEENVIAAYLSVKEVVDKANMALYKGEPVVITDEDFNKCLEMLKVNFNYKKTDKAEIFERIQLLEGETLLSFREKFQDVYG